jgi:hypothetical protein
VLGAAWPAELRRAAASARPNWDVSSSTEPTVAELVARGRPVRSVGVLPIRVVAPQGVVCVGPIRFGAKPAGASPFDPRNRARRAVSIYAPPLSGMETDVFTEKKENVGS